MVERNFWYQGEAIENLPTLNSTQISHVVMFHTRSEHCHDYESCVLVISELEVSCGYQLFIFFVLRNRLPIDLRNEIRGRFHSTF